MITKRASIAVWDVPMPVTIGETFTIKVGVMHASGETVEVCDASGLVVASGTFGGERLPETEALYWTALDVPSPTKAEVAQYTVRAGDTSSRFAVAAAPKPEHRLTVAVTERETAAPLAGVEIRLGPFRARTDSAGRAEMRVSKGDHRLHLWRTAHIAEPQQIAVEGDAELRLTMLHVPEEHPDARWVR
jgi:hypothetical protein